MDKTEKARHIPLWFRLIGVLFWLGLGGVFSWLGWIELEGTSYRVFVILIGVTSLLTSIALWFKE